MNVHFGFKQHFDRKRLEAFGDKKEHYKMFKAGKHWLYAGIFLLSMSAGLISSETIGHADTSAEDQTSDTTASSSESSHVAVLRSSTSGNSDATSDTATSSSSAADTSATTATSSTATSSASSSSATLAASTAESKSNSAASTTGTSKASGASSSSATSSKTTSQASSASEANVNSIESTAPLSSAGLSSTENSVSSGASSDGLKSTATGSSGEVASVAATAATSQKSALKFMTMSQASLNLADTNLTLNQIKTATTGLTHDELVNFLETYNAESKAKGGTIYVLDDNDQLIQVTNKAATYTVTYTYKDGNGNTLAPSKTLSGAISDTTLLQQPVYVAGYQIDMDKTQIAFVADASASLQYYFSNLGGLTTATNMEQFLNAMFDSFRGNNVNETGTFNYVYKKSSASITPNNQTITVGDPVPALSTFVSKVVDDSGNTLDKSLVSSPDYASIDGKTPGTYKINLEYFNSATAEYIIGQATLTVKAQLATASINDSTITYGDDSNGTYTFNVTENGPTVSGLNAADFTITDQSGAAPVLSGSGHLNAGTYTVKLSASGLAKFAAVGGYDMTKLGAITGKLTVNPKPVALTLQTIHRTYTGSLITDFTGTIPSGVFLAGDKINYTITAGSQTKKAINAGTYMLSFNNGTNSNYVISPVSGWLVIDKADATVTIKDASKVFGSSDPSFTVTVSGVKGNDTLKYTISRESGESVGTYSITGTDAATDNLNYDVTFGKGIFTITPQATDPNQATDQVTVSKVNLVYGQAVPTLTLQAGSDKISLAGVTYSNSDFVFTDANGNVVASPTNAGTYTATLSTAKQQEIIKANPNYSLTAANFIAGTVTITKAPVTVQVNNQTKVYGEADPILTATEIGKVGQDSLIYKLIRLAGENVGTYTITGTSLSTDNPNYDLTFVPGTLTITPLQTTPGDETTEVSVNNQTITFGDATPTFTVAYGDEVVNHVELTNADFTFDGSATIPTNVGTYQVALNADAIAAIEKANPNYTFSASDFIGGTYTINPLGTTPDDKTTEVTVNDQTITYGDDTPTFTVTYGDKVVNHVALTNADFTFDGSATIPTNVGTYQVALNADAISRIEKANPNYTFSASDFIGGTYTINPLATDPKDAETKVTVNDQA
ncbi:MBG domain-containing protein, partial [Secundilactobacillus folii]